MNFGPTRFVGVHSTVDPLSGRIEIAVTFTRADPADIDTSAAGKGAYRELGKEDTTRTVWARSKRSTPEEIADLLRGLADGVEVFDWEPREKE